MSDCCVCALRSCRTCLSLLTGTWNAWLRCSPTNVTHRVLRQRFFMLFRTWYWRDVKTVNFFETSFTVQFLRQRLGVFSPRFGFFSPRWSVLYITTEKEGFPALASRDVLRACLVVTAFFFSSQNPEQTDLLCRTSRCRLPKIYCIAELCKMSSKYSVTKGNECVNYAEIYSFLMREEPRRAT